MHIEVLTMTFSLPGCQSLKEKRQRVNGIRDKFGKHTQIALVETGRQDDLLSAEWTLIFAGNNKKAGNRLLQKTRQEIMAYVDAEIVREERVIL